MMQSARNRTGQASLHLRTARSPRGSERHRKAWEKTTRRFFLRTASDRALLDDFKRLLDLTKKVRNVALELSQRLQP